MWHAGELWLVELGGKYQRVVLSRAGLTCTQNLQHSLTEVCRWNQTEPVCSGVMMSRVSSLQQPLETVEVKWGWKSTTTETNQTETREAPNVQPQQLSTRNSSLCVRPDESKERIDSTKQSRCHVGSVETVCRRLNCLQHVWVFLSVRRRLS